MMALLMLQKDILTYSVKKIFDKKSNMQSTDCMEMNNKKKFMVGAYSIGLTAIVVAVVIAIPVRLALRKIKTKI